MPLNFFMMDDLSELSWGVRCAYDHHQDLILILNPELFGHMRERKSLLYVKSAIPYHLPFVSDARRHHNTLQYTSILSNVDMTSSKRSDQPTYTTRLLVSSPHKASSTGGRESSLFRNYGARRRIWKGKSD
jgi:hypothetical protein